MKKYKLFENSDRAFVAIQILEGVAKSMLDELAERCDVRLFTNGREEGYTICVRRQNLNDKGYENNYAHATFSEYRNSDEIVLYTGSNVDPGFGTASMAASFGKKDMEKEYADKRFFRPTPAGRNGCVAAIVEFLNNA